MTNSSSSIIKNQSKKRFLPKLKIKSSWNSVKIKVFLAFHSLSVANDSDIMGLFPEKTHNQKIFFLQTQGWSMHKSKICKKISSFS